MNIVRYMLLRLKTLRGMTVVHVGAHVGQEISRYENMLAARVVWVEASPDTFSILASNVERAANQKRNVWSKLFSKKRTEHICINALISDGTEDEADFYVYANEGAASSIFKLDRTNTEFDSVKETGDVLKLPVKTLDAALAEAGVDPSDVDVLVLDTQGAELKCLAGASCAVQAARYIETEVSTKPVYEGGVLLNELEPWLKKRGFKRDSRIRRSHMNTIFCKVA